MKQDEFLQQLLSDPSRWILAANVLRSELNKSSLSREEIKKTLDVSQASVQRFLDGRPTLRAFKEKQANVGKLLRLLKLTPEGLAKQVQALRLRLCINNSDEGAECVSVYFHPAGDHAVPFPSDPRTDREQEYCRWCGGPLRSDCPECGKPLVAASHCPICGCRYLSGVPGELQRLVGQSLVEACERRNSANRAARQFAERGSTGFNM